MVYGVLAAACRTVLCFGSCFDCNKLIASDLEGKRGTASKWDCADTYDSLCYPVAILNGYHSVYQLLPYRNLQQNPELTVLTCLGHHSNVLNRSKISYGNRLHGPARD